jgi:hypothetical protein
MYPHERSLVNKLEGKPFALLGVNSDEDRGALKKVIEKEQITWRSWWDRSTQGPIARKWNVHGWPTVYVLDDKGVIRYKGLRGQPLEEAVKKLLKETEPPKESRAPRGRPARPGAARWTYTRRTLMMWAPALVLAGGLLAPADEPKPAPAQQPPESKPAASKDPELRKELLARMKTDQDFRKKLDPLFRKQAEGDEGAKKEIRALTEKGRAIDHDNTAWMKGVIDKHGWPGKSRVGSDGAMAAFLLVQHADDDPTFQKKCLELMAEAVKNKEASASNLAYLTDRVSMKERKKQVYGTQLQQVDGKLQPAPIEDEANVDRRRKEVGLPPLADYVKMVQAGPGAAKKKEKDKRE